MPIDHTSICVKKEIHKKTVDFYLAALKPLRYKQVMALGPDGANVGLGLGPGSDFWVIASEENVPATHFAFTAEGMLTIRLPRASVCPIESRL